MLSFRTFLTEGGNAVKGVSRINQENSHATVKNIYDTICPMLRIEKDALVLLGSATKKEAGDTSGDIDMAISIDSISKNNKIKEDDVLQFLFKRISKQYQAVLLKGFKIVSLAFPIENTDGKQENSFVQLDIMLSDDLQHSVFGYYSPTKQESKYKGTHRNILIGSVLKHYKYKVLEQRDGKPFRWESYIWSPDIGLQKVIRQLKIGRNGETLKTEETVDRKFITKNLKTFVNTIFGDKFTPEDINSFESVLGILHDPKFEGKDRLKDILATAKDSFSKNNRIDYPKELK